MKLQGSEKAVVARHEAGHAVVGTAVANLLPGQPRVEVYSSYDLTTPALFVKALLSWNCMVIRGVLEFDCTTYAVGFLS